jgi:uncharacterized protein (TIGR02246 family)
VRSTPDVAGVLAAERERCRAIGAGDPKALAAVLADDLHYGHSVGFTEGKSDYIRTSVGGTPRTVSRGALDVRPLGDDVALVVGDYVIVVAPYEPGGAPRRVAATGLQVWVRRGGRWLLRAHQGTPEPDTRHEEREHGT